jgi:penicillin-binding protein 2
MLVIDQVRRSDPRLRSLALLFFLGFAVLLVGLWYVQIVSGRKYEDSMKVQALRTVRLPAARGRILDRNGQVMVDNQPRFNINLYLEDIRPQFTYEYTNSLKKEFVAKHGRSPKSAERGQLEKLARYRVVSNIVWQVSTAVLPQPRFLDPYRFEKLYNEKRAIPMSLVTDLTPQQIALFFGKASGFPGVELEVEPYRFYPYGSLAAHALGYTRRAEVMEDIGEDDENAFNYRTIPVAEYHGVIGLEGGFDEELRGKAGLKAILVNNIGYRQSEETWVEPSPGKNLVLTLDLEIQKAAELALAMTGSDTRGAVVVLNVKNGDVLALASSPAYDLNMFVQPGDYTTNHWNRLNDALLTPQYNRALQGAYHPGSTFKMIVALAAFEAGVADLGTLVHNPGYIRVGNRPIKDNNAPIGDWAFMEAFKRSANTYFIHVGLEAGAERLIDMGRRFNLGDKTGVVQPYLESKGLFPEIGARIKEDGSRWTQFDTALLCIGQGQIMVTPLQMALVTAAIANGGQVLRPRLVMQVEEQGSMAPPEVLPALQVERNINVKPQYLEWVRRAMLDDVQDQKVGTGKAAYIAGMDICGKTGTAQIRTPKGMDHVTWFVSFAPFDSPKYAVVVVVEGGGSGGGTCAPKAKEVYKAIQKIEQNRLKNIVVK